MPLAAAEIPAARREVELRYTAWPTAALVCKLGCGTRKRLPTALLSLRWNEKPYEGDDQGGMLRSILHKESSGWSATGLEVDHYGGSQNTGGRVWLWNEKLASITFYNEAVDARAKLGRNVSNDQPFRVRHLREVKNALRSAGCRIRNVLCCLVRMPA